MYKQGNVPMSAVGKRDAFIYQISVTRLDSKNKCIATSTGQRNTLDIMSILTEGVNNGIKVTSWLYDNSEESTRIKVKSQLTKNLVSCVRALAVIRRKITIRTNHRRRGSAFLRDSSTALS